MKISIIVPVYNTEQYLKECLDSIMNQTYTNLEIIVIDDGSTDSSLNIINKQAEKDSRIKTITISNHGQAYARKIGIFASTGDYIGFVDSDDVLELDYFETHIQNLNDYNVDISILGYKLLYENDIVVPKSNCKNSFTLSSQNLYQEWLSDRYLEGFLWNKVFKKELFFDIDYETDFNFMEDVYIVNQLIFKSKNAKYLGVTKYFYRQRTNSTIAQCYRNNDIKAFDVVLNMKEHNENPMLDNLINDRVLKVSMNLMDRIYKLDSYDIVESIYEKIKDIDFDLRKSELSKINKLLVFLFLERKYTPTVSILKTKLINIKYKILRIKYNETIYNSFSQLKKIF